MTGFSERQGTSSCPEPSPQCCPRSCSRARSGINYGYVHVCRRLYGRVVLLAVEALVCVHLVQDCRRSEYGFSLGMLVILELVVSIDSELLGRGSHETAIVVFLIEVKDDGCLILDLLQMPLAVHVGKLSSQVLFCREDGLSVFVSRFASFDRPHFLQTLQGAHVNDNYTIVHIRN
jgi:hypothetical protein